MQQLKMPVKVDLLDRYIKAMEPILSRVRRDVSAIKNPDGNYAWTSEPLTDQRLRQHLSGGSARGVAPMNPGESTTRLALLDFDSHRGETKWGDMTDVASKVIDALAEAGYSGIPFRSTGGRGIHVYLIWDQPQDAHSVRHELERVIGRLGFKPGTNGVAQKQIEIFPKQDEVRVGGYGNQFILPLAGKSEPLDHLFGLMPMGRDYVLIMQWPTSAQVPLVTAPPRPERSIASGEPEDIEIVRSALMAIPNDDSRHYDDWFPVVCAVHEATGGSEAGRELAIEWSQRAPKFDLKFFEKRVWPHITPADGRPKAATRATLFHKAFENGWQKPTSAAGMTDEVEQVSTVLPAFSRTKGVTIDIEDPAAEFLKQKGLVLGQERDGKLLVVCPWVGEHTQGKDGDGSTGYFPAGSNGYLGGGFKCLHGHCEDRKTSDFFAAIGYEPPGTNADGMDDVDTAAERNNDQARLIAARRKHQRLENLRIGEGAAKVPAVGKMTLEDMLSRFVFLSDGSQVADLLSPGNVYAFADFAATYAASKIQRGEDRKIPVASLWKTDPHRKTAEALTFKAGGPLLLRDTNGRMAVNSWRPIQRESVHDLMAAGVGLFLDHAEFLFPIQADRERFLDWLAHIEQKPGELPHTAWLHVARNFGMGRNWLASVLARVWAGSVAANLDLPGVLKSGFNGRLSRKLLAVVDEIHEGGRDGPWEHAEKLKSIITEETRLINPKYGRQSVEFNSCRFLMFSNHVSAIPLETGDRRIEVVATDAPPRDGDYYEKLYRALDDPGFINAVGVWLAQRDLRRFNPGQHARMSEAKMKVVQASLSPMAERCQSLTRLWPSDLITAPALYSVLQGPSGGDGALTAFHRRTLEQFGVEPLKQLRVSPGASPVRVSVIRNHGRWRQAVVGELRDELAKCPDDFEGAWHWLAGAEADQAQAT